MDSERKFVTIIDLFKRSFLETLNEEDAKKLREFLNEPLLAVLHEKMKNGTLIEEGYLNQIRFSCQNAFRDFENRTKYQKPRRPTLFHRLNSVAAILIIGITISVLLIITNKQEEASLHTQNSYIIRPRNKKAQLQLENGDVITLSDNRLQVEEKGGVSIYYDDGVVSYITEEANEEDTPFNELFVPAGGECYLVFSDGTKVWLNSVTKLKYPIKFSGIERKIYLEGEAYFEVTPDKKPFIVHTSSGEVKVLGTSFGIRAYICESMTTTLVSGKVVYQGKDTVQLIPGEQIEVHPNGKIEKHMVDVDEFVGWKSGVYVFNKRSLEMIMNDIERWYDVEVIYHDSELKHLLFSGDIDRYDDINTFLELLKSTEEIRYKIKDKTIELYR